MEHRIALNALDWIVILVYGAALMGIGFWVSFRRRGADDLFLAGRSLGWCNVGLSIFATNISPAMLIASCGTAYTTGMVIANFEWLAWFFMLLLSMLFVPHYLNMNISTMPEFLHRRFGPETHAFLSWYMLFTTIVSWMGATLYTGGILFSQIMGWQFLASILVLTLIATSFTVAGGLAAVVITDAFQSVLMIFGATSLTLIGLTQVGSLQNLLDSTPAEYWTLIRPAGDADFPWPAMFLGYPILGIWFWCTDQTIVQRVLGAKNLHQGQLGTVFAGYLKILPPFLFVLPGILCYVLYPDLSNSDEAFVTMVRNCLPAGMVGLIVAVLIAALISTVDSALNSFSTVFTLDIFVKYFCPAASKERTRWIGRAATVGAAVLAVLFALFMDTVGKDMFNMFSAVASFIAPPISAVFVIGILWNRATSKAAIWSLLAGSVVSLSVGVCHLKDWPDKQFWPHYLLLAFYLFLGIAAFMVVVSLCTHKDPREETMPTLAETYANQNTQPRFVWFLWGALAVVMTTIYLVFK